MGCDVVDRVIGQILPDLGDDPRLDVFMKGTPQLGERSRRSCNNQRRNVALPHRVFECGGDMVDEPVLLEMMPVGLLHAATPVRPGARKLRPGRSVPCSRVGGFFSPKTCSVRKSGNFSSPTLRKNNALRPSPMKTKAS
jgi:hypothetical protein